ncbi:MAG: oxygen-insensitive NAD(P)H nitroreductase [Alphaproteobacteria bacterium]|nr:oxygen-insensitive NAD(P)H nitroreductase [Alphaproteobacteria bacterium]
MTQPAPSNLPPNFIADLMRSRYTCKAFDRNRVIEPVLFSQIEQVLRYAASSVNSQPWHYVIATSDAGKNKIAQSTQGPTAYNESKILNASHSIVFCRPTNLASERAELILQQEIADGRHKDEAAIATARASRNYYFNHHSETLKDGAEWMTKQVYLSFGMVMMAAASLGIDSCPMEGFDSKICDQVLGLSERGLTSVLLLALGYRAANESNGKTPKSRLGLDKIITRI